MGAEEESDDDNVSLESLMKAAGMALNSKMV